MTDQGIRLYKAITDIDDEIIEEAQKKETPQKTGRRFYVAVIAAAAAACVILAGVLLYSGAIGGGMGGSSMSGGGGPAAGGVDSEERDYSPISYKLLMLPEAKETPGMEDLTFGGASVDIASLMKAFFRTAAGSWRARSFKSIQKNMTSIFMMINSERLSFTTGRHTLSFMKW